MLAEHETIRVYDLGSVVLEEKRGYIFTRYPDGSTNVFSPPMMFGEGPVALSFRSAALEMGYSDPMRYAVEHELAHHIGARARFLEHSPIVWDAAHGVAMSLDEPERAAEEHLTNQLQRYMNLGVKDDEYGCLDAAYGDRLPAVAARLMCTARPWLRFD